MARVLVLLVAIFVVSSSATHDWDRSDKWEESKGLHEDYNDDEEASEDHFAVTNEDIAANAISGAMHSAGIHKNVVDAALAQLTSTSTKDDDKPTATKCETWAMGDKVTDEAECTEGNIGQCLTSRVHLKITENGKETSKTLYTSNCDKMRLCTGMGEGYYTIEEGHCGTMPGEDGQDIYCSRGTPPKGKIPEGTECKKIVMKVKGADDKAAAKHASKDDVHLPAGTLPSGSKEKSGAGSLMANSALFLGATVVALAYGR